MYLMELNCRKRIISLTKKNLFTSGFNWESKNQSNFQTDFLNIKGKFTGQNHKAPAWISFMHCTNNRKSSKKQEKLLHLSPNMSAIRGQHKIQCFQTAVLEDIVALTTQLMSTLDRQFTGILMLKIADLMLFIASVLISTEKQNLSRRRWAHSALHMLDVWKYGQNMPRLPINIGTWNWRCAQIYCLLLCSIRWWMTSSS